LTTAPRSIEANAQLTCDFARTKGYSDKPFTAEKEVSLSLGFFTLSVYSNSDGGSGFRTSVGLSTTKSKMPVTATYKVTENE